MSVASLSLSRQDMATYLFWAAAIVVAVSQLVLLVDGILKGGFGAVEQLRVQVLLWIVVAVLWSLNSRMVVR